ncbi:MAG: 50S ribosomal protein L13 [Leptospiraceae bacterium]|nr:50S ribosomal protein L13 [Leptospiraceae bacterium]
MMGSLLPSQRTRFTRNEEINKQWILVDAENQNLGRLACSIANRLRGKHRRDYAPHQDIGDFVIVINASRLVVTGKKMEQKKYYDHSLHPGGLKTHTLRDKLQTDPAYVLKKAVWRMLPSGPLARKQIKNLKIYAGEQHEHGAQQPQIVQLAK